MFGYLLLDWQRRRLLRKAPPGPMRDYLARPFSAAGSDWRAVDYLAIDLETTGLDYRKDVILSVGHVTLSGGAIVLASSEHRVVRIGRDIPAASAVIHQITDDQAALGEDLEVVLADLLAVLAGKVLIAHHARIETTFLSRACQQVYGVAMPVPVVDTQVLAQRQLERRQIAYKGSDLRLHALGERYNLPRYAAHNAFYDALSAAELFLAQATNMGDGRALALRDILA
jgi:DNA polymerase III subunit epsilon